MTRKPLFLIIPVIAVIAALVLFLQRDNTGRSANAPSASGLPTGSGANMPPSTSMDPTPSGTPRAASTGAAPTSATPTAPSGEAARPAERR